MSRYAEASLATLTLVAGMLVAGTALARTSDRNQPMDAEANQNTCTLGDAGQCVMTGNVKISQGSLNIDAGKAVIFRAGGDISRALLSGSPVVLRQQMDDGTPMTAHSSNVDYNLKTEVVIFTGDVQLEQPRGSMSGQRVVYNLRTGSIDSGGQGNGRVKMRILPRNAAPAPSNAPAPAAEPAADQTTP